VSAVIAILSLLIGLWVLLLAFGIVRPYRPHLDHPRRRRQP
jgi:hypothetical protein